MPNFTLQQALERAWSAYQSGQRADAESLCRQILRYHDSNAGAQQLLGLILCQAGQFADGLASLQKAIELEPANADFRNNIATVLSRAGQLDAAEVHLWEAVRLNPNFAEAFYNIANIYRDGGQYSQAMDYYRRAISLKPDFPQAQNNLANALKDCGQVTEALKIYRDLLALHPDPRIGNNYVYAMHFEPDVEPHRLLIAHRQWNDDYAAAITSVAAPHAVNSSSGRKLRIGYVSPDFRNHPVGRFMRPLLRQHDAQRFEIHCYSDVLEPDSMTARLRSASHVWRETAQLDHDQLSRQIRADRVDILVDLTMHMEGNRLLTFARRPAPVQATYLAYCSTTGLTAMDYRISDPHLDPPGVDESLYAEKTIRLKHCYWCYEPPMEAPQITPRKVADGIVFGCLNNFGKVNAGVIAAWSEILLNVDNSRLILYAPDGDHRHRAAEQFATQRIDPSRISFVGVQMMEQYMDRHQQIDIALDPFPYPGGTTSCDALWMGTPIVTLTGQTAVSRSGASILKTIGLDELVTDSRANYIATAVALAGQTEKLTDLRSSLRQRMQASTLMNTPLFARDMEAALTEMWENQHKTSAKQG